jgi:hypothetical protein
LVYDHAPAPQYQLQMRLRFSQHRDVLQWIPLDREQIRRRTDANRADLVRQPQQIGIAGRIGG